MNTRFSSAKAAQVLGWSPTVDLESGVRTSRDWLARIGLLLDTGSR
jgi:hypothetical protein